MGKDNTRQKSHAVSTPLTPLGECWVSDVETTIQLKGNRFRLLRALIDPRVTTIRLQQTSAAIFMNAAPRDN